MPGGWETQMKCHISLCLSMRRGDRGNRRAELLLNYIRRIQRGVITGGGKGGDFRSKDGERAGQERGETSHPLPVALLSCHVASLSRRQPAVLRFRCYL